MPNKKHYPLVRTIYLYIFALLGLIFSIIGSIRLVDMGLKVFIFTKAEEDQRILRQQPFTPPYQLQKLEQVESEETFSEEEKEIIKQWVQDYKEWQEEQAGLDYLSIQRQKDASNSLAFIMVGFPLYLYHWRIIKRETKNSEKKED
jgi:hypothetical protein